MNDWKNGLGKQLQEIVDIGKKGIENGISNGDFLMKLTQRFFPENDPDRRFFEWLHKNCGNLRNAMNEMGIEIEDGKDFITKLRIEWKRKDENKNI